MKLLPLSIRIPMGLTIFVVITGIVAFLKISKNPGPFPTTYLIIWIIVSIILVGITIRSWLRNSKSDQHEHD
jgi:nitrogen fixation-related uncharacterized protein